MRIVFDNYTHDDNCKSLWGFSLYLEEYKLLFDTGSNGRVLLQNLKHMKIDVKEIEYIFLSHHHWDHMGGIDSIIELNSDITVFVPESISNSFIKDLKTLTNKVVVCKASQKLFDNVYTTGVLGKEIGEQSLIIDGATPTLVTGCSHYGIESIVAKAKKIISKDIQLAIGGFHLKDKLENQIIKIVYKLQDLGVKQVVPTHCIGDLGIKTFKRYFKDAYISGGVGKNITIQL